MEPEGNLYVNKDATIYPKGQESAASELTGTNPTRKMTLPVPINMVKTIGQATEEEEILNKKKLLDRIRKNNWSHSNMTGRKLLCLEKDNDLYLKDIVNESGAESLAQPDELQQHMGTDEKTQSEQKQNSHAISTSEGLKKQKMTTKHYDHVCDQCDSLKYFSSRKNLNYHMISKHRVECTVKNCNFKTMNTNELKSHQHEVHGGSVPKGKKSTTHKKSTQKEGKKERFEEGSSVKVSNLEPHDL